MGKIAAYLGPPAPIATIVEKGSHPLLRHGPESPDGFGIGWYPKDGDPAPLTLASRMPVWSDDHLLRVARRTTSGCVIAAVRRAQSGDVIELSGCQPFQHGTFLFQHEGELARFREVFERPLRRRLSDRAYQLLNGQTSSELLFATWLDALGDKLGGEAIANALESMVNTVRQIATAADAPASFSVVVSDGSSLVTLRTATHGTPPPMYTIVAEEGSPVPTTGRVIASEPIFPGAWSSLDLNSIVIFAGEAPLGA